MRNKLIVSAAVLALLTGSAQAGDFYNNGWNHLLEKKKVYQTVGWDQRNLDVQTRTTRHLHARIKKLENENEQLRNSISLIRAGRTSYGTPAPDPRIQGLVEENKRLSARLMQRETQASSAKHYLDQLVTLKSENQNLSRQIEELNLKVSMGRVSGESVLSGSASEKSCIMENRRLKQSLSQIRGGEERMTALQQQVHDLKTENAALKTNLSTARAENNDHASILDKGAQLAQEQAEIVSLKKALVEARNESRDMRLALANATQELPDSAHVASDTLKNQETIRGLKERLVKSQEKNRTLQNQLDRAENRTAAISSEDIDALRQQNESLRETIRAQSEMLLSADNAAKTAERLLTENTALQRKLQLAQQSNSSSGKNVQEMMERIKNLEKDVAQRDGYIKKMLASKAADLAVSSSDSPIASAHLASLNEKNSALVKALDKEKETNLAYRRKLIEYQKELEELREMESASASGMHRASIFERHVKTLEQKQQEAEDKVAELKLKNQELEARLELVQSGNDNKVSPATIEPAAGYPQQEHDDQEHDDPMLKEQEEVSLEHSNKIEDIGSGRFAAVINKPQAESLLATEMHPLAE
ncbi:MAG: hypothetical protein ACLFP8_09210 [Alphaproteobacteria bacterium]